MLIAICNNVINKSRDFETLAAGFKNYDLSQAELASEVITPQA